MHSFRALGAVLRHQRAVVTEATAGAHAKCGDTGTRTFDRGVEDRHDELVLISRLLDDLSMAAEDRAGPAGSWRPRGSSRRSSDVPPSSGRTPPWCSRRVRIGYRCALTGRAQGCGLTLRPL